MFELLARSMVLPSAVQGRKGVAPVSRKFPLKCCSVRKPYGNLHQFYRLQDLNSISTQPCHSSSSTSLLLVDTTAHGAPGATRKIGAPRVSMSVASSTSRALSSTKAVSHVLTSTPRTAHITVRPSNSAPSARLHHLTASELSPASPLRIILVPTAQILESSNTSAPPLIRAALRADNGYYKAIKCSSRDLNASGTRPLKTRRFTEVIDLTVDDVLDLTVDDSDEDTTGVLPKQMVTTRAISISDSEEDEAVRSPLDKGKGKAV